MAHPTVDRTTDHATAVTSPWLSAEECAGYLGVALGTIRNWTSARFIPHSKRGGVVRYHRDRIDEWLSRGGCGGRSTMADRRDG